MLAMDEKPLNFYYFPVFTHIHLLSFVEVLNYTKYLFIYIHISFTEFDFYETGIEYSRIVIMYNTLKFNGIFFFYVKYIYK